MTIVLIYIDADIQILPDVIDVPAHLAFTPAPRMSTQQGFGLVLNELARGDSELASRIVTASAGNPARFNASRPLVAHCTSWNTPTVNLPASTSTMRVIYHAQRALRGRVPGAGWHAAPGTAVRGKSYRA